MKRNIVLKCASAILFVLLFVFGLRLAALKPLWNDELYSQIYGVQKLSYGQILSGRIPEGNNAPLFYLLQKGVCDLRHFQLPFVWKGQWSIADPWGQLVLRVMPDFCMALALAIIFYMMAREYSLIAGAYAFLTALSSCAVWVYWVEARPYALWFALTVFELVYFLRFIRHQDLRRPTWWNLTGIHILLSLTAVFGAVQVFIVSMILFWFYERNLKRYFLMLFLPLGFGFFYFLNAPHYVFQLPPQPLTLVFENVPQERILFLVLCAGIALTAHFKKAIDSWKTVFSYSLLALLFFSAALGIMFCFALTGDSFYKGFVISSRYFIFLAPVGIIATTIFLSEIVKNLAGHRWIIINFAIFAAGLLVLRSLNLVIEIFALGIY